VSPCGWVHAQDSDDPGPAPRFRWLEGGVVAPRDEGGAPHLEALRALGTESLIDAHTHWFPDNVNAKIWAYFDRNYWPITYRGSTEERLAWMRQNGVRHFTTLTYAHRPGMAAWLNEWSAEFASRVPEAIPCGTFFPESSASQDVRRCIESYGFRGFKLHLRVGDFDPSGEALHGAFERIEAAGLPVVIHSGSAPEPGRHTTPAAIRRLLMRFPRLRLVIAHMGAAEFESYLSLAETYPGLHLDTTMVFVGFGACDPFPAHLVERLETLAHKILYGSDFPTIPYPISHAVRGILNLPLSARAKRAILGENARALFAPGAP
jgi:predicted TIM-barrel fold metal-dependent hydrolase